MAAGDVEVFGPTTPNKLKDLVEASSIVVADDISMCSFGAGMVVVIVIKAA